MIFGFHSLMYFILHSYSYSYANKIVMPTDICVFCNGEEPEPVERGKLGQKALDTLKCTASAARQKLPDKCVLGATYHNKCKLRLIRSMESSAGKGSVEKRPRVAFPFRTNCLFCGVQVAKFTDINLKVIN